MILHTIAGASEPAGGAALDQVVVATAGATIATALLLWLLAGHRSGRVTLLGAVAGRAATIARLPAWAALPAAIAGLSERQRQMVIWRYYEDRSFEEIAGLLQTQPATVRSLLRHALANLRRRMRSVDPG